MKALIIVDVQNDFLPGGALAVPDGDLIIPLINDLMPTYELVVATQDWHPAEHGSFSVNHEGRETGEVITLHGLPQMLWPTHCVIDSEGSQLADALEQERIHKIFYKGTNTEVDSYSGFYDNGGQHSTGLAEYLKAQAVTEVDIVGLATDYCVKFTALDALKEGFKTTLIKDACKGVNLKEGDVEKALSEIQAKGGTMK